jgi:hypothetical protein
MRPDESAGLQARSAALEIVIKPYEDFERAEIEASIAGMLSGFRSMRHSEGDAATTVAITRAVLRDFPAWAIKLGCMKIARRETGCDPRFAPNDAEIAEVVRSLVKPYREAFDATMLLISAVVQPVQTRQRSSIRETQQPAPSLSDGKHAERIAADLAARKARNEAMAGGQHGDD